MAIRGVLYYTMFVNARGSATAAIPRAVEITMTLRLDPISDDMKQRSAAQAQAAVDMMRRKVATALGEGEEPSATAEMAEVAATKTPSKHQLYMQELGQSGKSLAEIQTAWHRYYTMLPEHEKNEVWQEFYASNKNKAYEQLFRQSKSLAPETAPTGLPQPQVQPAPVVSAVTMPNTPAMPELTPLSKMRSVKQAKHASPTDDFKKRIVSTVTANGKLEAKHHWQSLFFGLGMGAVVLLVLMFGFFNEYVLAPFVQPSRKVTAAPIIVTNNADANAAPTVMIPKINIQIPIDFGVKSIEEATVQASLEGGVVHYPSTALPGQNGNGAYFGHSSQNIFNNGKYKFAFVLLHQVTTGDIFYITYQGKRYVYQVFAKEVVPPSQVSVLNDTKGRQATAVLITCDPPGFSTNRLVVWGEQISPSPVTNSAATVGDASQQPAELASKGPSAWSRFINSLQFWKQED